VLRKLLIAAALAGVAALPAAAATGGKSQVSTPSLLMPGVGYQREVQYTLHGPVVLDVVTTPKPDGKLYTLSTALSNNAIVGTEPLTTMTQSDSGTVVGVNGDFFAPDPGSPTGIVMRGGVLDSAPALNRSSLGIGAGGSISIGVLGFDGTWRGTDQRRQLDLNKPPVAGHTTLYTSSWGPTTPAETGVVADTIGTLPATVPNSIVAGAVTAQGTSGSVPIPPGGAVLVARGNQAPHLQTEAPVGTNVQVRLTLTPDWSSMSGAIGGGPLLVANGKPVFRAKEAFGDQVLNRRDARSAVGQLADGRILLVTAEGGSTAYSAGMTNFELASAMAHLGAVSAMALGTGNATGMAFDGTLLTRPVGANPPPLSDALVLSYTGVYQAPPSSPTLSPNGDGVDDTETFTYKVVRPSQVTATLVGPDGSTQTIDQEGAQVGPHTLTWSGSPTAGEGTWKLNVVAVDDRGVSSTATRDFSLNETLGGLTVTPATGQISAGGTAVTAAFSLAHAAKVTVTVEKRSGVVIDTLVDKQLKAGAQSVAWDGRMWTGSLATTGEYQIHVVADNTIGTAELVSPFTARRS
jgi:hypothetical protein